MKTSGAPASLGAGPLRCLGTVAVCILLAATLLACAADPDSAVEERMLELEAKAHSLEESLESLLVENAKLRDEIAALRREQAEFEEVQEEQLANLVEGQARNNDRLEDVDVRLKELERAASGIEGFLPLLRVWFNKLEERLRALEGTVLERTRRMAEAAGGEVYNIDDFPPGVEDRSILIMPLEIIEGETPLIVSMHGYGGNSADHSLYFPLHERVNEAGFGLLLANGTMDAEGNRFWNPTDRCCDSGKSSADDVAYLTELVNRAKKLKDFGPVYIFGHSNGGFMSYHMACKGLPGLRAVASLAGTSYVEDSSCDGAPPVSVLHIHGTADGVIQFEGEVAEPVMEADSESAFYAGAQEMVMRWGQRAGCDWPEHPEPYATLDLDQYLPGPETYTFRMGSGCADGINIELWMGEGSGHSPGYGDDFVDALVDWLLSQK
jgi:polyhydroxybutyrate depolymerase